MEKELINQLYNNRLLRNRQEIEKFEEGLDLISEVIQEDDISELCSIFDDNTMDDEVMFGLVHLIEIFSSEKAFEFTVLGIGKMIKTSPNWAKIIIYRCLNDDFSRKMLKNAIDIADKDLKQIINSFLYDIKNEDYDKFGGLINEIME